MLPSVLSGLADHTSRPARRRRWNSNLNATVSTVPRSKARRFWDSGSRLRGHGRDITISRALLSLPQSQQCCGESTNSPPIFCQGDSDGPVLLRLIRDALALALTFCFADVFDILALHLGSLAPGYDVARARAAACDIWLLGHIILAMNPEQGKVPLPTQGLLASRFAAPLRKRLDLKVRGRTPSHILTSKNFPTSTLTNIRSFSMWY